MNKKTNVVLLTEQKSIYRFLLSYLEQYDYNTYVFDLNVSCADLKKHCITDNMLILLDVTLVALQEKKHEINILLQNYTVISFILKRDQFYWYHHYSEYVIQFIFKPIHDFEEVVSVIEDVILLSSLKKNNKSWLSENKQNLETWDLFKYECIDMLSNDKQRMILSHLLFPKKMTFFHSFSFELNESICLKRNIAMSYILLFDSYVVGFIVEFLEESELLIFYHLLLHGYLKKINLSMLKKFNNNNWQYYLHHILKILPQINAGLFFIFQLSSYDCTFYQFNDRIKIHFTTLSQDNITALFCKKKKCDTMSIYENHLCYEQCIIQLIDNDKKLNDVLVIT